jgi:hypothetical protein
MTNSITIKGKTALDTLARKKALDKINSLSTEELQKLEKMCTPKGRKMLQTKWNFIKGFI